VKAGEEFGAHSREAMEEARAEAAKRFSFHTGKN